ncbi:hypothetical protein ASF03_21240 [Rhizobium sp. Leaf68]|nr:hypothetical protein ASE62_20695 [Rhizobium sp. Leaf202]KQN80449.1 hypothetical protein ASF03_21240 [Rhizobium sp. Leaf68]
MPNNLVQATAEGMLKFDRSAIMRNAWARYRRLRQQYADWQIARGIVDASFSACLVIAWRIAKEERAGAAKAAKVADLVGTPTGKRLRALNAALEQTNYLSLRYSAAARRAAIKAEISFIVAH